MPVTEDSELLWRSGNLRYKLHSDQRVVYDAFRLWQRETTAARLRGEELPGRFPRIWLTDCSRRWGKDFLGLVIAFEDAMRRPNAAITYATAFLKDLGEILIPLATQIMLDCPPHLKPQYRDAYRGLAQGLYFPKGSVTRFVGVEKNPDSLRGRFADSVFISEGAYVDSLDTVVNDILMPQLLGRPWATIMMNSTPPKSTNEWVTDFVPDAAERRAYTKRTIFDCPLYSESEKVEFITAAGGIDSERARREYLCENVRTESLVVVPEFNKAIHVEEFEIPEYALGYTVIDPAVQDLCALNVYAYDFENAQLLIVDEWTKRNSNTEELVQAVRDKEKEHFSPLFYWDGQKLAANPYQRISDTDLRLITDFRQIHKLDVIGARKDDAEAALHALRNAFLLGKIKIHPRCVNTIEHFEGAIWNKSRNSYKRSEKLGHADHVDCTKYAWRHVDKNTNPNPPHAYKVLRRVGNPDKVFTKPEYMKTDFALRKVLNNLFSTRRSR